MENERRYISLKDIWTKGLEVHRSTRRQVLHISLFALFLPHVLFGLWFDGDGSGAVAALRSALASGTAGDVTRLLEGMIGFVGRFATFSMLLGLVSLVAYLALVVVAVEYFRGHPAPGTRAALWAGVRQAFPKGIIALVLVLGIVAVGQYLLAPAILVAILCMMVPVILVAENQGALSALGRSVLLRYTRSTRFGGWTVLFATISLGACCYAALLLVYFASEGVLRLDEWMGLPRGIWATGVGNWPFSAVFVLTQILETAGMTALIGLLPSLTVALYFLVTAGLNEEA